ncbi:MAG: glycosyltransferase family 2 protein [Rhodobacteraceae bacterium]|nr:glycosyltransferase family 2 protein [Paracoccaceae bacterium]
MRLSLVIPTRERASYLGACLDAALAVEEADFEIIVCDNASNDATQEVIAARAHDPRLRAVRQRGRVSMRMNFETGLAEALGDYLVFIGDDDAILPGQLPMLLDLLKTHKPDVASWTPPGYGWPVAGFSRRAGKVRLERGALFGAPRTLDVKTALQGLQRGEVPVLPSLYHGAVSRRFLDRIGAADGVVFGGSVPDVYFGMRALYLGGDFLLLGHPFSVNGYGPASTGHAHHAYDSTDPRAAPAHRFAEEARADPLTDAVGHIQSVPGVFFATLETVRARMNPPPPPPDRAVWYARVLAAIRPGDSTARQAAVNTLTAHARASGTDAELSRAKAGTVHIVPGARPPRPGPLSSIAISARRGGRNDVQTAAEIFDAMLGRDYADVLSGSRTPDAAWRATRARALQMGLKRLLGGAG